MTQFDTHSIDAKVVGTKVLLKFTGIEYVIEYCSADSEYIDSRCCPKIASRCHVSLERQHARQLAMMLAKTIAELEGLSSIE